MRFGICTYINTGPKSGTNIPAMICILEHHPPKLILCPSVPRGEGRRVRASFRMTVPLMIARRMTTRRVAHRWKPRPTARAGRAARLLQLAAQLPHQALQDAQPLHDDDGGLRVVVDGAVPECIRGSERLRWRGDAAAAGEALETPRPPRRSVIGRKHAGDVGPAAVGAWRGLVAADLAASADHTAAQFRIGCRGGPGRPWSRPRVVVVVAVFIVVGG